MITLVLAIQTILELLIMVLIEAALFAVVYFVGGKLEVPYNKWKDKRFQRRCQKAYELILQQNRERELRKEEMENYPLFYWKDGIV